MSAAVKNQPATPLPWKLRTHGADTYIDGNGALKSVACDMTYYPWIETEDMPYIVHACNAYPKLVEALRNVAIGKPYAKRAADLLRELGEDA